MKLGLIFGGQSCEHEVSVVSARSFCEALANSDIGIERIAIDRNGSWWYYGDDDSVFASKIVSANTQRKRIHVIPGEGLYVGDKPLEVDAIFPMLHGTFGEDGTIQGLFEMAHVPYIGSGVLGSAVAMDKGMARAAFARADIEQPDYQVFSRAAWRENTSMIRNNITNGLPSPWFVKPCNMGSSVGIRRVTQLRALPSAIEYAFEFDERVIVEQGIVGARELECAVMGNHALESSVIGEILPADEFYSYDDKYVNNESKVVIPAELDGGIAEHIRLVAQRAYRAVDARGMARVDFFLKGSEVFINEINTLPGFTPISMFPQLWQASGLDYPAMVEKLARLAIERFAQRSALFANPAN